MDLQDQEKIDLKAMPEAPSQAAASEPAQARYSALDKTTPSMGSDLNHLVVSGVDDLLVGTLLDQKYEILTIIGSGGMGRVYKARHVGMNKLLAIKTMHRSYAADEIWRKRFLQEAKTASSLANDHLVAVHDFGETPQGEPYLVMDYVHGITLSSLIKDGKALSLERAMNILSDVCQALDYAHEHGVIHRDVKPSNIMIYIDERRNEKAKLVDFGVCKPTMAQGTDKEDLTRTGDICGSPRYMSPEQCLGRPLDLRADVYSFGCVMYEVFAGSPPFTGENSIETIMRQVHDKPVPVRQANPKAGLPPDLDTIVLRCLEKEPDKRYQTMEGLRRDIELVRAGKKVGKSQPGWRPNPLQWIATLALLALIPAVIMMGISRIDKPVPPVASPHTVSSARLPKTPDEARTFAQQAYQLEAKGNMYQAGYMLERVLPVFEKAGMESSPEYGSALINYAICLRETGHAKEALPLLLAYCAWTEQHGGTNNTANGEALFNLGLAYHYMHQETDAIKALRKSIHVLTNPANGAGPDALTGPSLSLANALHDSGDNGQARPLYEKYLRNADGTLGDTSGLKLGAMEGYAWTLQDLGELKQAENVMRQLVALREAQKQPDYPSLARNCGQLSKWLRDRGQNDESDELLTKTTKYAALGNEQLNPR